MIFILLKLLRKTLQLQNKDEITCKKDEILYIKYNNAL
jgi:hypothetical protein